ncbi:flagellar hook-associated protein 1 FlgK [Gracilibacillus ureilyticus]|uniref:Flagellar hook-associated protein 1 n=1 Tax=Gracilibacillus ureilyticus TaxID=531814 RepID=A0A1H9NYV3_9BACI|nr:flagellar hook-associated protein FlgK [Gracilibacillus ureilyticus]SER40835.1 flagellar hook-associated protein 1 FlgK [Gracilibacillus ureilyticus]
MASTFNGLEVAKRALHAQQSALYTTGHNIANANTEGYTRQRVNFEQTSPYPPASRNRPEIAGQIGSGVEAGSIERIRDSFIDKQYRQENTKVGFYETKADMMSKLETILNEPSEQGISQTFDLFWKSLQDLSVNPEDSGSRSVVKERAVALAEVFNYAHDSLQQVRGNLKDEIGVDGKAINSLIDQINQLNGQIAKIEPHGYVPNDLYDERDRLVDQLSSYVDIKVDYKKSSGQPSPIAQGIATITLNSDPSTTQNSAEQIVLVDGTGENGAIPGSDDAVNHMYVDFDNENNARAVFFVDPNRDPDVKSEDYVAQLVNESVSGTESHIIIYADDFNINGKVDALLDGTGYLTNFDYASYDVDNEYSSTGEINDILNDLDKLVKNFVTEFNTVHSEGFDLEGDQGIANFFVGYDKDGNETTEITADNIAVNSIIKNDVNKIAASTNEDHDGDGVNDGGASGNGSNAVNLADVYTKRAEEYAGYDVDDIGEDDFQPKTSAKSFFESIIGELGVITQESNRMQSNSQVLRQQVEESRQAISSVSLDEEMTNLIQFQHAYNAAARNMTVVDEMLDRIINNMGLVGR